MIQIPAEYPQLEELAIYEKQGECFAKKDIYIAYPDSKKFDYFPFAKKEQKIDSPNLNRLKKLTLFGWVYISD